MSVNQIKKLFFYNLSDHNNYNYHQIKVKNFTNETVNNYCENDYMFNDSDTFEIFDSNQKTLELIKNYIKPNSMMKKESMYNEFGFSLINYKKKDYNLIVKERLIRLANEESFFYEYLHNNFNFTLEKNDGYDVETFNFLVNCIDEKEREEFNNYFVNEQNQVESFSLDKIHIIKFPVRCVLEEDELTRKKINETSQIRIFNFLKNFERYGKSFNVLSIQLGLKYRENLFYDIVILLGNDIYDLVSNTNNYYKQVNEKNLKFIELNNVRIKSARINESKSLNSFSKRPEAHHKRKINNDNLSKSNDKQKDQLLILKSDLLYDLIDSDNSKNKEMSKDKNDNTYTSKNKNDKMSNEYHLEKEKLITIDIDLTKDIYEMVKPKIHNFKKNFKLKFNVKPIKENLMRLSVETPKNLETEIRNSLDIETCHLSLNSEVFPDIENSFEFPTVNYFISKFKFDSYSKIKVRDGYTNLSLTGNKVSIERFTNLTEATCFLYDMDPSRVKDRKIL